MPASPPEKAVLGIDAAWTAANPSGVALASRTEGIWRLVAVAASFEDFIAFADTSKGSSPASLVAAATHLAGRKPDLIAVDMPMMDAPIFTRRAADNAVNRAYAGRGAGTHSPTVLRPGAVGRALEAGLSAAGYPLATLDIRPPCRIEIYPHPALIEIMGAPYRLPYKSRQHRQVLARRAARRASASTFRGMGGYRGCPRRRTCRQCRSPLPAAACRARPKPQVL